MRRETDRSRNRGRDIARDRARHTRRHRYTGRILHASSTASDTHIHTDSLTHPNAGEHNPAGANASTAAAHTHTPTATCRILILVPPLYTCDAPPVRRIGFAAAKSESVLVFSVGLLDILAGQGHTSATWWRNGSAFDSRSKGWGFDSLSRQAIFGDLFFTLFLSMGVCAC